MGEVVQKFVNIAVPKPIQGLLTYKIPESLFGSVAVGSVVEVPFRAQATYGFVVEDLGNNPPKNTEFEIKSITKCLYSDQLFSLEDLKFYQWISSYYQIPLGEVFYSAYPKILFENKKSKKASLKNDSKNLIDELSRQDLVLTEEQKTALEKISDTINHNQFKSFLLFGITGSGKTEVYIRAAKRCIELGKSVLILVPEIALTPQLRERFEKVFQENVAVIHSGLTEKSRREFWWDIKNGLKKVVVGARSAIFAPLSNIGLIVVDEEHEPTYKQEDRVRYNARDLALVRAQLHSAAIVLGSATPSVETFYSASKGKYELLELKARPGESLLPEIEIVDLKKEIEESRAEGNYKKVFLGKRMLEEVGVALQSKKQSILFVNRKGYSNFLLCRDCGYVPQCLNCSVSLTYYLDSRQLKCHYCDFHQIACDSCPKCNSYELIHMGMGTELIEEQVKSYFPEAKVARLDASIANSAKKIEQILQSFRNREIDILIGTQMLAKGHDFPDVTFVGVVLADSGLHFPDFRSNERTFQLLTQVAGRAGRGQHKGKVIFQTFVPDHYVIQSASNQNYLQFYNEEIEHRKDFDYPPFSRIAQVEFRHLKEGAAQDEAHQIQKLLEHLNPDQAGFSYLGPSPASIAKISNKFRYQILLKAEKYSSLSALIKTLRKNGVRLIDVDPVSTL